MAKEKHYKVCNKCVMNSTFPSLSFNEDGICSVCTFPKSIFTKKEKMPFVKKMEKLFEGIKKKNNTHNILVSCSGGKDSSFLLYLLKNKFKLNPLAFTVVHPLFNNLAKDNIERLTNILNVDLVKFYLDEGMYKEFIRFGLAQKKHIMGPLSACILCDYLREIIMFNYAVNMNIPIIAAGFQIGQHRMPVFFNKNKKEQYKKMYSRLTDIFRDAFGSKYRDSIYDLNFDKLKEKDIPCLIYPFTMIDYDTNVAYDILDKIGLKKSELDSVLTNCDATHFFSYLSYRRYGSPSHIKVFSSQLRHKDYFMYFGIKKKINRKQGINLLNNIEKALYFFARNKKAIEISNDDLRKRFPELHKFFGKKYFDIKIDEIKKIHHYSDFFKIGL